MRTPLGLDPRSAFSVMIVAQPNVREAIIIVAMITNACFILFLVSGFLKYLNSFTQAFRDVLECFTKWLEIPKVISHCDKYPNRI